MFKNLFMLYDKVKSKGDSKDIGLTNYYNDKNDNSGNGNVNKSYDVSDIDEEVAREVVERFI